MRASLLLHAALAAVKCQVTLAAPAQDVETRASDAKYRYLNSKTKEYLIKSLPVISDTFDIGEMYSGLVPVYANVSRSLFFVFQPTTGAPVDEITIWLNGGPGCSSLEGFLEENGRFVWQPGTAGPALNKYAWTNLTNMLWVEQPVGVGFSVGANNVTKQSDLNAEFISWFKNFQITFGISNYKIYVTGESYAGVYIPQISAAMLDQNDTTHYNLKGNLIYDPVLNNFGPTSNAVVVPYANAYAPLLGIQSARLSKLNAAQASCGYSKFLDSYLAFPPAGPQPARIHPSGKGCNLYQQIYENATASNNCFDVYHDTDGCPYPSDVLGYSGKPSGNPATENYFERTDVKQAMHAPESVKWVECSQIPLKGAPASISKTLPQVIEATDRVLISNGDLDFLILTNATLLAIQNMTWHGKQGFQSRPNTPILVNEDKRIGLVPSYGIQHFERGVMWAETYLAGHMGPEYQPRIAYRHLQWVLGLRNQL